MRLSHGTHPHSGAVAIVIMFVVAVGVIAPGSPLVPSARAAMSCGTQVWGGRTTNTLAWGQGLVVCSGTAGGGGMELSLEHCDWDLIGGCFKWTPVAWMGSRSFFGPGTWWVSGSSAAKDDHLYHVVMYSHVQSTATGIIYTDENTTTQWRQ